MSGKPSTLAWIIVHLVYPLVPVAIEGVIRLAALDLHLSLETFSAATLAVSTGLLSVFVNQSIRGQEVSLPDPNEVDARNGTCAFFMTVGMASFVLFGVVVLLYALVHDRPIPQLVSVLKVFQIIIFVGWVIPVVAAVVAQRSFKLRASLV
jgi:hypothetical protein